MTICQWMTLLRLMVSLSVTISWIYVQRQKAILMIMAASSLSFFYLVDWTLVILIYFQEFWFK
jgi:hypothetical protein